ncbi:hypothetical protein A2U01_0046262 [Trifolium medium]|uniref:Uncharacterized protein n=1 Tax=Trifolium medium TaxID=97028 RepID=A0A392QMH3_9FABA|nr:hypothetical protein [Trifolium medium]
MEDPPPPPAPPSEASTSRLRGRSTKNPCTEIDADEEKVEQESSPDDFDEERPTSKRHIIL